ncbi:DsbA family protein [Sphingomonas canadensis]|uniref:DsbA family protein n=1 Tax=Sphingomonas canadensis TaxID=1219257 RepID=A0ABW3H676_9SPHN|nr:DsbA family protein [Sphingomonas canadensis]MCW3835187.1 DsbA family protein [Sphingomonas canadensis]
MIEKLTKNRWAFAAALAGAAAAGALIYMFAQRALPGSPGDRAQVEQVVRDYLLEHPEILPEAMERLQAKQEAAAIARMPGVTTPYAGAWMGNPKGDVTVVAFLDYNCGYCRSNIAALTRLVQSDPNVRIVYREYPVLGEESVLAARWALAAAEQGKFREFHEALYAIGRATPETIDQAATRAGLDKARATAALASKPVEGEIGTNYQLGRELRITGTPGWVIGHRLYQGAQSYEELVKAVTAARNKG